MMPTNVVLRALIELNLTFAGSAQEQAILVSNLTTYFAQYGKLFIGEMAYNHGKSSTVINLLLPHPPQILWDVEDSRDATRRPVLPTLQQPPQVHV